MNHNHMIYYLGSITVLIIITGIYRKTYVPNVQKNQKKNICSQWYQRLCFCEYLKVLGSKFSKRCLNYFKLTLFFCQPN